MSSAQRQAAVLAGIALVTGLAALFGPAERWGGVDIGATGSALFGLTLVTSVIFFARRPEVFPDNASVAEQRAWIGLLFIGFVLLSFLRFMGAVSHQPEAPRTINDLYALHFLQHLFSLLVAWQLISHLVGRHAGTIQLDERDLRLQHAAHRAGDWMLTVVLVACICALALLPASLLEWWLAPIVLANLLIGLLIGRSLVEHLVLTLAYWAARR
jgi:uncharacterized membrane protein